MNEYKIALFGSGGILLMSYSLLECPVTVHLGLSVRCCWDCWLVEFNDLDGGDCRGGEVEFDGTICIAYVDGEI